MPIELPATAIPLKTVLTHIASAAEGPIKKQFRIHLAKRNIKHIYDHLRSIGKVRTIWQTDKPTPIKSFYYPQKIIFNEIGLTIRSLSDLTNVSNKVVVQGIVGQGKSIFLRYLCIEELKKPTSIPVFLELRKISKGQNLVGEIREYLGDIGLDDSKETFNYLMSKNKISILLDAYDELDEDIEKAIYKDIERFCKKYPDAVVIISSRPNYAIQNSEFFVIAKIAPLADSDLMPLLVKLCPDIESAQEINKGITGADSSVGSLLTTPLMVTLLIFVYKADRKIPTKPIEFYDSLFITVLSRHDKSKPGGLNRNRKTTIADSSFLKIFNCISFLSSQDPKTSFKQHEMISYLDQAQNYYGEKYSSDDLLVEICKITCLLLKDGFDFNYLHKSIQEYHAAMFVSSLPESKAIEFYSGIRSIGKWKKWREQIGFLVELDKYRCNKYFILPSCDAADKYCFSANNVIRPKILTEIISRSRIGFKLVNRDDSGLRAEMRVSRMLTTVSSFASTDSAIENFVLTDYHQDLYLSSILDLKFPRNDLMDIPARNKRGGKENLDEIELSAILRRFRLKSKLASSLSKILNLRIENQRNASNAIIQQLENTDGLFRL